MLASGNHQYKIPKLRFPQAKGPTVLAADAIGWCGRAGHVDLVLTLSQPFWLSLPRLCEVDL